MYQFPCLNVEASKKDPEKFAVELGELLELGPVQFSGLNQSAVDELYAQTRLIFDSQHSAKYFLDDNLGWDMREVDGGSRREFFWIDGEHYHSDLRSDFPHFESAAQKVFDAMHAYANMVTRALDHYMGKQPGSYDAVYRSSRNRDRLAVMKYEELTNFPDLDEPFGMHLDPGLLFALPGDEGLEAYVQGHGMVSAQARPSRFILIPGLNVQEYSTPVADGSRPKIRGTPHRVVAWADRSKPRDAIVYSFG